jgi:hypothetical protein
MYKLNKSKFTNEPCSVNRDNGDGSVTSIPFNAENTDYQAFLKYQAEGGKVYGADEEIPADEENT